MSTKARYRDLEIGDSIETNLKEENKGLINEIGKSLASIKAKSNLMKEKLTLSNKTTEEIETFYDSSLKIVSVTISKFKDVLSSSSGLFCYMFVFIIILFIYLYWRT